MSNNNNNENHTPILQAQREPSEAMKEIAKQLKQETAKDLSKATPFTGDQNRIVDIEVQQPRKFEELSEEEKEIVRKDYAKQIKNKAAELSKLVLTSTEYGLYTNLFIGFKNNGIYYSDTIDEARTYIRSGQGSYIYY